MKRIKLTKGLYALVDDVDFERVSAFKWYASFESRGTKWYARRKRRVHETRWKSQEIRMHHFVLNISPDELPKGHVVDHDNDDGLDNRRLNLQIISQKANMEKVPGWKKKGQRWPGKKRKCNS